MASLLSILKNIINLKRVHVEKQEFVTMPVQRFGEIFEEKQIHIWLRPIRRYQSCCPICRQKCPGYDYRSPEKSWWRASNLNGIPVYLFYHRRRIACPVHGVHVEYVPWADGDSRFTETFNNEVAWMALQMSKLAVSILMGINWRTVGNCIKAAHERIEPDVSIRLHGLRRICVDETSYRKGHAYITVVYNMDRNQVVWVHEDHGQEIFAQFCELMTEEDRAQIEIVAGDGAQWIDRCTEKYFPNATRCIDFFHVVEWANEALDDVRSNTAAKARREYARQKEAFRKQEEELAQRRSEAEKELAAMPKRGRHSKRRKELEAFLQEQAVLAAMEELQPKHSGRPSKEQFSTEHQKILNDLAQQAKDIKGARYALGHKPENRTENQTERLKLIENSYPDLYRAYQMKETLRLILHLKDCNLATDELDKWISDASACGLKPMEELAVKIQRHRKNIFNSIRFQANSAKSESTNTTIKALIKMARGFRNLENMKALIYLKCSDLVIPLNNRQQPSAERRMAMRLKAAEQRRAREEIRQSPELSVS
ncbi:MAG: ISL3 family transposase [Oscillospiraceae bacterium]|nr:ISL3 family transposase [Oscillospiraceae bacterium]